MASGAFVVNLCKAEGRIAWRSLHVLTSRVRLSAGASSAMTCTRIQLQMVCRCLASQVSYRSHESRAADLEMARNPDAF